MHAVLSEIEACLHGDHYLAAVMLALSVPDIAAALGREDAESTFEGYRAWFDEHVAPLYPRLTAEACWSLKRGLAPEGRLGPLRAQYARVLFTTPSAQGAAFHAEVVNDALNLDTPTFCRDMAGAGLRWLEARGDDPVVRRNLARALEHRPAGLDPFMVGVPLLA